MDGPIGWSDGHSGGQMKPNTIGNYFINCGVPTEFVSLSIRS